MAITVFSRRYPIRATTVRPYHETDWSKPQEPYYHTVTIELEHYADGFGRYAYSEFSRKVDGVTVNSWREELKPPAAG